MPSAAAASHFVPSGEATTWKWWSLLAAPFLICLTVLLVTGRSFPTFWDIDEINHWALIQWFARGLPRFKANYPASAATPLFHLAGACLVRLFGPSLPLVRACNTLLSIGGVLALFQMLRRPLGHTRATAALFAAVLLSSCYYFGYAFRLLTDNMALVGCLLAMVELFRFEAAAKPAAIPELSARGYNPLWCYLRGCGWCGLTILTRQSYMFLCLPFGLLLLASPLATKQKVVGAGALALALVPFALLVLSWHGLVPPAYREHHTTPSLFHWYPLALPVMILGLYTPFFFGPGLWRRFRAGSLDRRRVAWSAVAVVAALAVLGVFPLFPVPYRHDLAAYIPEAGRVNWAKFFGGWIYSVADRSGRLVFFHNSFLFWLALPLGAVSLVWCVPDAWHAGNPRRQVAALFLVSILLSSTLNVVSAQKYYDGLVLLYLMWRSPGEAARDPWRRNLLLGLILCFGLYAAVFPRLSRAETVTQVPLTSLPPPP